MDFLLYVMSGALVGLIVGITGIGGGSLMTPLLLLFGIPPHIAVGTDLLYAAITKASGVVAHHKQKTINWSVTFLMVAGSIPTAIITGFILSAYFKDYQQYTGIITASLGVMLVITATLLLFRKKIQLAAEHQSNLNKTSWIQSHRMLLTVIMGIILGVFVTLSSVGAGAIGTVVLLILYPYLRSIQIIGTDLAHAVPLTLVGGLVHLSLGNVDYGLLGALLIGSIPAIHLGSKIGSRLPENILRNVLAGLLMILGIKYIIF
ncbi:sulfite exporter TauE/SafE family protein [Oceaniserpentilla sp. 4NH20-0058]|uniref:sulfite exporter TauE/SafE family protein n=1 Tax=Oceaniserpentilla sp. 4NH20-0058 TaxID=3127660 RepID=UPI00310B6C9C